MKKGKYIKLEERENVFAPPPRFLCRTTKEFVARFADAILFYLMIFIFLSCFLCGSIIHVQIFTRSQFQM